VPPHRVKLPQMKLSSKNIIDTKHLPFVKYLYGGLILNSLLIILLLLLQKLLPPEIPLFYGMAEGEEQIAKSIFIVIPNAVSLLILVVNSIIASYVKQDFYKKILITAGLISTFFSTITALKILFLVGNL
jgi:hypothetical protein